MQIYTYLIEYPTGGRSNDVKNVEKIGLYYSRLNPI